MTYGSEKSLVEHASGTWAMIPGNGLNDDQINNQDKGDVWYIQLDQTGYMEGDFNMDGNVNEIDKNMWVPNSGKGSRLPE